MIGTETLRRIASSIVALGLANTALATTHVASVFTDNAVLQQGMPVPVWGDDDANANVTVTFAGQSKATTAGADGKWSVRLDALKTSDDAAELVVAGSTTVRLSNVLVGEVWVCSGQSNMELTVDRVKDAKAEIAKADYPAIRLFTVERQPLDQPGTAVKGKWELCSPATVAKFSATAYFFGRGVHTAGKVPIGLIESCWGGTTVQAWSSAAALKAGFASNEEFEKYMSVPVANADQEREIRRQRAAISQERKSALADGKKPPAEPVASFRLDGEWGPSRLYNGMIAPLMPYAVRGAIWYQGESNAHGVDPKANDYQGMLTRMIGNWRSAWGERDFPFLIVQLPNYGKREQSAITRDWSMLREWQANIASTVPNVGLAVTIDTSGDGNLHPTEKQPVGERLSLVARGMVYGEKILYEGPTFTTMSIDGGRAVVLFKNVADGLHASGDKLNGFYIAGDDHKFVPATATIAGNTVILQNDEVKSPVAVRYAWASNPDCNLYNSANLPARPFRTDDWR